jgi:hypothetical protein
MGVAQLTLSCDRSCDRIFITNLCFIRPFPISSIWRADHGAGTPNAGFSVSDAKGLRRIECSKRELWFRPRNRDSRSSRANRPLASTSSINIKAGCAPPGSVSNPDHGGGLHACPSEIGGPEPNVASSGDFVAWSPHKPSNKSQGIRPTGICRLRLAPASGISALPELWPSG